MLYAPLAQHPDRRVSFVVGTSMSDPEQLLGQVSATMRGLDADLPLRRAVRMDRLVSASLGAHQAILAALAGAGALALLLSIVGNYGVLSFWVAQHIHEVGIRMALGARQGQVVRMVVSRGMTMVGIGLALGLLGAWSLNAVVTTQVAEIRPIDAPSAAAAAIFLALVAAVASFLPARRATRIDPIEALRVE